VALASIGQMDQFDQARPFLEELMTATGETSHLAVLDDGMALYVDKVESQRMLSRPSHVGRRLPAFCTGVGKALLAFAPGEVIDAVLARGLERFTPNTIIEPERLRAELDGIRRSGYAVDNEEIEEGLVCVAAPVRDRAGLVVAAVSIGGPASRVRQRGLELIAAEVTRTASAISTLLGWTERSTSGAGARPGAGESTSRDVDGTNRVP
jgi:DNA-binding IclR family transcriptional regulator